MARSILPSRYRSPGKHLALAKRANRNQIRAELRHLVKHPDLMEDAWDERMDLRAYPDVEIAWIVRWRRGGDKLAHFQRWAIATTKDMPIENRLSYLRTVLPDGLIGDHAMSHLRDLPELNPHPRWRRYSIDAHRAFLAKRRADEVARRARLARAIVCAIEHGQHKAMNSALKDQGQHDEEAKPPLIAGADIAAFVNELVARTSSGAMSHLHAAQRLIAFLEQDGYLAPDAVRFPTHFAGEQIW